ncbi:hypothetical protein [Negadavirga shengliensis]|uniref:Uncharacterized protein n=1 Tax=Negadavirga shengliensis TaxID=1389218 RepID=A0ABV9T5Z0_9BACT
MKKKRSDTLLQKLIKNKISRLEFEELLSGLEDTEMAIYLETSMKVYFDKVMKKHRQESGLKEPVQDKLQNDN